MQLEPGQTQLTPSLGLRIWNIFAQQFIQTRWWELTVDEHLTPLSAAPCCRPLAPQVRGVGCWCSGQALGHLPALLCQCARSGVFSWQHFTLAIVIFLPGGLLDGVTPWVYRSICCISVMPLIKNADYLHIICLFVLPLLFPVLPLGFYALAVNYPGQGSHRWLFGNKPST